jgi:hypothetical protein
MSKLGGAVISTVVEEYGSSEVIRRISDPYWFQSLGAVMGMDWHSSGITTSVMGALKKAINPISQELGLYVAGGRGRHSRKTPEELLRLADKTGINGNQLVKSSKLSAKIDNTAIQDGFQLYLHNFIVSKKGDWAVVQQGMNENNAMARRYHWHSKNIKSFVEEPHSSICGKNMGYILNLTDKKATPTREKIIQISHEHPDKMLKEIAQLFMPGHHQVKPEDFNIRRLGSILALTYEGMYKDFESLLLLRGLGPKTLRSLTLVSEVIHGTPSRFKDPARFSFAHGGKDGHPYPVQTKVYDETISELKNALNRSKLGYTDKKKAHKNLSKIARELEKNFTPDKSGYGKFINQEKQESYLYGGRTAFGKSRAPKSASSEKNTSGQARQLKLF